MAAQIYDKPCRELLEVAAGRLTKDNPDGFSKKQIHQWFESNYSKFKKNSVRAHITAATTNDPSRIHHNYLLNDLLFREEDRTYRLYIEGSDPAPITSADGDKVDSQKLPPTSAFTKKLLLDALHKLDGGYDHNFYKSNTYDVVHNGKRYPPKAVVGIAAEEITGIPFGPNDFNGGAATRCMKILTSHGIYWEEKHQVILANDSSHIVLTENDESIYDDITGDLYDFPSTYLPKIKPGKRFIYYKGSRSGGPSYFGSGLIEDVQIKPGYEEADAKDQRFYAYLSEYVPFDEPLRYKDGDSKHYESNAHHPDGRSKGGNYFRTSVRIISEEDVERINNDSDGNIHLDISPTEFQAGPEEASHNHSNVLKTSKKKKINKTGKGSGSSGSSRRSTQSKATGDWAEKKILNFLKSNFIAPEDIQQKYPEIDGSQQIIWTANEGEKPGYDISYTSIEGRTIGVEVKGTRASGMSSFELSANEWSMAQKMRADYVVALVSSVGQEDNIGIQFIVDPQDVVVAIPSTFECRIYEKDPS